MGIQPPTEAHSADRQLSRVLGLDHGARRVGVALSDELRVTAQPLLTLAHTNLRNDLRSIGRLLRRHGCGEIVVGWPIHLSGDRSPRAIAAEKFAEDLRAEFALPVHLWDERMSTAEAHRHLDAVGRRASDRKDVIDQIAAVLILQSWLDARQQRLRNQAQEQNQFPPV
jgi:putative Holliday junction resolvase